MHRHGCFGAGEWGWLFRIVSQVPSWANYVISHLNRMSACKVSLLSSGASWVELHPAALPSLHCTVLQTVLIHQILQHITSISSGHIGISICLCLALFATEFTKVLFWALAWAINYRTAIRLKVALSTLIFENLLYPMRKFSATQLDDNHGSL